MSSPDFSQHELRKRFLEFFEKRGHKVIPPSSLIPENDPTVLFTTAGMHPLVPYLLGEKHPEGKWLANIQPCLRTDDIDEVGDTYHHTFFEMAGNWSLGDYWKGEAIKWSWEFLTEELKIDRDKIAVSCFAGDGDAPRDDESAEIWKSLGISEKRIKFLGKKDNWWGPIAQTGPCGPDTEMFVWVGEGDAPEEFAGPEEPRWVEVWNDVFMEYDKQTNGSFKSLAQKNVDTGMGFERMLTVLKGTDDDYKTELFWPIIQKIEEISGKKYNDHKKEFRVIADHVKAAVFILAEDVVPSNKLQGYVLRRLIRRALVYFFLINGKIEDVMSRLMPLIGEIYKDVYPGVTKSQIIDIAEEEEKKYGSVLISGVNLISDSMSHKEFFDLYQSKGLHPELILELMDRKGFKLSEESRKSFLTEFEKAYKKHQEISRAGIGTFKGGLADAKEETARLHTAAHLLHAALRQVLGEHVFQKGSNITAERLRFDFSHPDKLTDEQIKKIEDLVNEQIQKNIPVEMEEMTVDEAKKSGALGVFDERYGNRVKVYTIPSSKDTRDKLYFSKEICGGPHARSTGELGTFKITNEASSSAGIRRIKAALS